MRVLVVEDQLVCRQILEKMLTSLGHCVVTSTDGASAIALLARNTFDLVMLDLQMPGMDGLTVTRIIRETPNASWRNDIPIIVISACATDVIRKLCQQDKVDMFMSKPVTMSAVQIAINNIFNGCKDVAGKEGLC